MREAFIRSALTQGFYVKTSSLGSRRNQFISTAQRHDRLNIRLQRMQPVNVSGLNFDESQRQQAPVFFKLTRLVICCQNLVASPSLGLILANQE